jgi:hypothetical protein
MNPSEFELQSLGPYPDEGTSAESPPSLPSEDNGGFPVTKKCSGLRARFSTALPTVADDPPGPSSV